MYLPVIGLSRSQDVRLGHGQPEPLIPNGQDPSLFHAFHVDLSNGTARRDLQRHSSIGSFEAVGAVTANWSDLFASAGSLVSAGTGNSVDVETFTLKSRLFTDQHALSVAAVTNLAVPSSVAGDTFYAIVAKADGTVAAVQGGVSNGTPVYEVDTVSLTDATAGTVTLSFTYNGFNYTTATIAYDAADTAVASAVLAATGGPALPATSITGTGGPLSTGAVTLTASGALEGPITNQSINYSAATGATGGSFSQSTVGAGAVRPVFDGGTLPLAWVFVEQAATAPTSIENIVLTA